MIWHVVRHHTTRSFRWLIGAVGKLEISVLIAAAAMVVGTWGFIAIADEVIEGETQKIDEQIMRLLRRADNPSVPVGPAWLHEAARDITGLGGHMILALVTGAVAGFVLMKRRYGAFVLVIIASSGAGILNATLKEAFQRERPSVVEKLVQVTSLSFPSGHAMASAAIYLSLAVLLAGITTRHRDRIYILSVGLIVTLLVGFSRVYLGVHYPTDVLAGWAAGLTWAMFCWLLVRISPALLARTAPPPAVSPEESGNPEQKPRD